MKKKIAYTTITLLTVIACAAFITPEPTRAYEQLYFNSINKVEAEFKKLSETIKNEKPTKHYVLSQIHTLRKQLKAIDIWLRYLEPVTYKKLNGPLPIEWETEVFEKFENPYRREGAGLTLAELYLEEDTYNNDSLSSLLLESVKAMVVYHEDSITRHLHTADPFLFANRLYILNLSTIYTTGFECPDTNQIIPELISILSETKSVYTSYNESFPDKKLTPEYLALYNKTIDFVKVQGNFYSQFNHYEFIREYVNPLFAINQKMINDYNARSVSFVDYTLNQRCTSIFDKSLFNGQNTVGEYFMVKDPKEIAELTKVGESLYFDPILSGNNMRSCASCHKPGEFLADTLTATSKQFNDTLFLPRNTPSLVNVVFQHLLMLDGRHTSLQKQGKDVTTNPVEMGGVEKELVEKVLSCKDYKKVFSKYLKYTPRHQSVTMDHIVSALTMYYGKFSFYDSPFDESMNHKHNLDPDIVSGFNLFMGKAQCATCHFIPQFNGAKPPYVSSEFEVLGVPNDTGFTSMGLDFGRFDKLAVPEMKRAFRTNTVRNTQHTMPYMYNGVFRTLEEVIDFYAAGGGVGKGLNLENQTLSSDSIKLSANEKKLLVKFIHSLTEKIPPIRVPTELPKSRNKLLNARIIGGEY